MFLFFGSVKQLGGFRESPLPFLSLMKHKSSFNRKVVHGVNFASGGSGILVQTGFKSFVRIKFLFLFLFFTVCFSYTTF